MKLLYLTDTHIRGTTPRNRLDEPAKHVSDEFIQPVARFLKQVSDSFGRQVIMVTQNPHLAETAEVAYQVVLRHDRSVARRAGGTG